MTIFEFIFCLTYVFGTHPKSISLHTLFRLFIISHALANNLKRAISMTHPTWSQWPIIVMYGEGNYISKGHVWPMISVAKLWCGGSSMLHFWICRKWVKMLKLNLIEKAIVVILTARRNSKITWCNDLLLHIFKMQQFCNTRSAIGLLYHACVTRCLP